MSTLAVIGGGASGMMAAAEAAKRGLSVTVFEKKEQLGKKLQATGNGHCNFTNGAMDPSHYRSREMSFVERFLKACPTERILEAFSELSLLYTERDGYYYPASNQAASVLSALSDELKDLRVNLRTDADVTGVTPNPGGGFEVSFGTEREHFDFCLLALGSGSGVKDRKPFRAYDLLKKLGHHVYEPLPALVPLYGNSGQEKEWAGVRTRASVNFGGRIETGEVQFTENGISGIPVFQISCEAVRSIRETGEAVIRLDLMPDYESVFLFGMLKKASEKEDTFGNRRIQDYLKGWLPKKLIFPVLKKAGVFAGKRLCEVTEEERLRLTDTLKAYTYTATGYGDIIDSQVTCGGLDLLEITDSFESKKIPGLFVTGELLDVNGLCGGYNLHFAFGSGLIAGRNVPGGTGLR